MEGTVTPGEGLICKRVRTRSSACVQAHTPPAAVLLPAHMKCWSSHHYCHTAPSSAHPQAPVGIPTTRAVKDVPGHGSLG